MRRSWFRPLLRMPGDQRGATIIEFAIVAPVLLLLIMGLAELCYQAYVQAVLTGAMQKAGRDSTIEGASSTTATIDAAVMSQVHAAAPSATGTSTRKSYAEFGYIDPEPFTDTNGDGVRETGECFTDINGNGTWDADPGVSGQGNASDAVVYTMTVSYPRLFPLAGWLGWSGTAAISATTVLKNQPYASQAASTPATVCT
jgi:Flp pilus assembly protein TadG